jgi:glycosyltransferase involved in cell wall biosynthesis
MLSDGYKPRLLLLTHYYPAHRGGIEIVAGQLASRMAAEFSIRWFAADCDLPPGIDGVRCEPQAAWNGLEARGFPWPIWSWRAWKNLKYAIEECDVLHLHDFIYPAHVFAVLWARKLGKPVVLTQHIGDIDYPSLLPRTILLAINRTIGRWMLSLVTQVVFISPRVKATFEEYCRFSRPPLYWPNGVDTSVFLPVSQAVRLQLRQKHGLQADKPVILFVGRFVQRKGLDILKRAVQTRPDWQWCFAGWGEEKPEIWGGSSVRVWRGLSGRSLAELYQLADCFILPSYGEGFPLVVQESLACGTSVVISRESLEGMTAIPRGLVPVARDSRIAEPGPWLRAIERCLAEQGSEQRMHNAAEARLRWDWSRLTENYIRILKSIL